MTELKQLSLMEAAERILSQNKNPMTFLELFKSLSDSKEMTDEEKAAVISQFYADFIVSAKFIYMGDDLWDLKVRQSIDMWDKDGAYYQEFPDTEGEEEELDEDEDEEEIEEKNEFELIEEDAPIEEETFDDDKYNEYMDDYEDMYDEE